MKESREQQKSFIILIIMIRLRAFVWRGGFVLFFFFQMLGLRLFLYHFHCFHLSSSAHTLNTSTIPANFLIIQPIVTTAGEWLIYYVNIYVNLHYGEIFFAKLLTK
jgi:hypothetical protein